MRIMRRVFTPPQHLRCNSNECQKDAKRINWIDWAKAIGIYLVVTGHANHNNADVVPMIFMIHMPLFFVISGFLFKTESTLRELMIRSFRGLVIPYLLYNIIASIYWILLGGIKSIMGQPYDWHTCIITPAVNTILGDSINCFDGPTWFLLALIWCKLFSWLLHRGNRFVKVGTIMICAIMWYIRIQSTDAFYFFLDSGLAGFIWFEIGHVCKHYIKHRYIPRTALLTLLVFGAISCYIVCMQVGKCDYVLSKTNGIIGILGSGAGLISFFSLCHLLNGISLNIVTSISRASIVIMCLHMQIQSWMEIAIHYQGPEVQTFAVDFIIIMLLTALFPLIKKYAPILLGGR